ncbi:MAG: hypothetical protein COB73_01145 [Flavobacteriaceae bacterium]|nr:MAG: hypothetical protein COB73_01145 [Flavobacteriaceae bacterium]
MKKPLLLLVFLISSIITFSQTEKQKAEKYLNERGELVFTFTANNIGEIQKLASMISFEHGQDLRNPLTITANVNKKEFQKFLDFGLSYTVDSEKNEPKQIQMYDASIHENAQSRVLAYPLTFPLSAYPTYAQYEAQMTAFATDNPLIAELVDIGGTVQGDKRLLFIKLSDNVSTREQEPRVMYTSSMHGDEIAGFPSMLNLIDYFITAYNDTGHADHTRVKNLLDNSEVWINPMANPDATYWLSNDNSSVTSSRRRNANNVDLNRNYPDNVIGNHPDWVSYEIETQNFMTLADNYHFVVAANFHGGAEVINYPWDNTSVRHPDDDWYFLISKEYAVNCQNNSPNGYMDDTFTNYVWPGVTNGNDWYEVFGGRQDYMNYEKHVKEITIELSGPFANKTPSNVLDYWNYNQEAYIEFLIQGTYGFTGLVKDANTLNPIKAKITLVGHDALGSWVETELPLGDYYRPINAGTYDILFEADCYQPYTLTNQTIADYQTINLADVFLTPVPPSVPSSLSASSITISSATLNWSSANGGTGYDIRYRVNGSSTWTNTTSVSASLDLTGLILNTTYEYQIRSVCNATTSSYSVSSTFTTLAVSYCASNGNSVADEYIGTVQIETINNTSGGVGYVDFTANITDLVLGTSPTITITPTWTGSAFPEGYSVWIDYNQDGDFADVGEQVWSQAATTATPVGGAFSIPGTATLGSTRMRVSMKYNGIPTSCETFSFGEVEDYTVNIVLPLAIEDTQTLNSISIYPNPVKDQLFIRVSNEIKLLEYKLSNILGKTILSNKFINSNNKLDVSLLNSGMYFLTINTDRGVITKKIIIE